MAAAIAISEEILRQAAVGDVAIVISWEINETALVLGRSAGPSIVDEDACRRAGIPVVRRHSGGGPLLWDAGLVAVDVILPKHHPLALTDVVEAYRWLGEAGAAAHPDVGVPAGRLDPAVARAHDSPDDAAVGRLCFGGLSPHEIVVGAQKIGGLCQARRTAGSLLQLGVLVDVDSRRLAGLVHRDGRSIDEFASAFEDRVTTVADHAPGADVARVRAALETRISAALTAGSVEFAPE